MQAEMHGRRWGGFEGVRRWMLRFGETGWSATERGEKSEWQLLRPGTGHRNKQGQRQRFHGTGTVFEGDRLATEVFRATWETQGERVSHVNHGLDGDERPRDGCGP